MGTTKISCSNGRPRHYFAGGVWTSVKTATVVVGVEYREWRKCRYCAAVEVSESRRVHMDHAPKRSRTIVASLPDGVMLGTNTVVAKIAD